MLTVTKDAAAFLKAAKATNGASNNAGIRIKRGATADRSNLSIGFAISEDPYPADKEVEQDGLRIFVEDVLVEPLDGCRLDVREAGKGKVELVFR